MNTSSRESGPVNMGLVLAPSENLPVDVELAPIDSAPESRIARALHFAKAAGKSALVAFELLPVTNEGSRYGALAYTEMQTQNPLVGAAVLGGATLLVEGAGALASAKWIAENKMANGLSAASEKVDGTMFSRVNPFKPLLKLSERLSKLDRVSPPVEAGMAMTLGTVATLEAKQRVDPDRTYTQNVRRGLFTAGWMSSIFALEGALVSEGVGNYTSPTTVGASLLGLGGIMAGGRWAKKRFAAAEADIDNEPLTEVASGFELTSEEASDAKHSYETYRAKKDGPILIGLFGEDLDNALQDPETIMIKQGEKYSPLLVPIEKLEWYNLPALRAKHGDVPLYCYVDPELPDDNAKTAAADAMAKIMDEGGVILYDQYGDESPLEDNQWQPQESVDTKEFRSRDGAIFEVEALGTANVPKKDNIFAGEIRFSGVDAVKEAPGIYDTYVQAVEDGRLVIDRENGVSIQDMVSEEEAEKIWQIYKRPFERLSEDHPLLAGFDEETLKGILFKSSIPKVVNRVEGEITTVAVFPEDLSECPWFNAKYYQQNYPEYYATNNILICPSIVTDQERRGSVYSGALVDLMTKVAALRDTNIILTFECTEISTRYIPKIVKRGVDASGVADVNDDLFAAPVATLVHRSMKRANVPVQIEG